MNIADFDTAVNGFPLEADATLGFMQASYSSAIRGLAGIAGGNGVILSGLNDLGSSVSDGWIWYGGDVVFFQGGAKQANFVIIETATQKANLNGTPYDRYFDKKAQFGSGTGAIAFSTLRRIDTIEDIRKRLLNLYFESEVIIEGCEVSNIVGSNLEISAGLVLINSTFKNIPAYSGAFPVYLNDQGVYVSSQPGGNYIKFDPHTSQKLADIIRRSITPIGDVKMKVTLSDLFDNTGLGKWSELGWALCNGQNGTIDLRGRVPLGYDSRTSDPADGIWDAAYNTPGAAGGEKSHVLSIAEMPSHNHTENTASGGNVDTNEHGLIRRSQIGEDVTADGADVGNSGTEPAVSGATSVPQDIPYQGGDQAHENRQPFRVLVYVQKI